MNITPEIKELIDAKADERDIPASVVEDYINETSDDDLSDFDEAYQGEYPDDEDFARDTADQLGSIDKNAAWPTYCIDWEYAARELMMDYFEIDGHYFRNL